MKLARDEHYPAAAALVGLELPFYSGNVLGARNGAAWFNRAKRLEFVTRTIDETGR